MYLSSGTQLQNGRYRIGEKIGQGGFGITYKGIWLTKVSGSLGAIDAQLPVCIKEFYFEDYCSRQTESNSITILSTTGKDLFGRFKEKLLKEATILSQLSHPNIVRVIEVFEENNTAYMVMDFIDGTSLKDVLKTKLPEHDKAISYTLQIADALDEVHSKNVLHLDIKPSNIIISKTDGRAMLIDFGISKRYNNTHEETSNTPLGRSKGYAPIEQYLDKGAASFSPALDVYALGATCYHLLTGVIPVEANERVINEIKLPTALNNSISKDTEAVLLKAMALKSSDRYQTINAFSAALKNAVDDKTEIIKPEVTIVADKVVIQEPIKQQPIPEVKQPGIVEKKIPVGPPPQKVNAPASQVKKAAVQPAPQKTGSNKKWIWVVVGAVALLTAILWKPVYMLINHNDDYVTPYTLADTVISKPVMTPQEYYQFDSLRTKASDENSYGPLTQEGFEKYKMYLNDYDTSKLTDDERKANTWGNSTSIFESLVVKKPKPENQDAGKEKNDLYESLKLDSKKYAKYGKILGTHAFSNQWISWDYFGQVTIKEGSDGKLSIKGRQIGQGEKTGSYTIIDGVIEIINEKHLKFTGRIEYQAPEMCDGKGYYVDGTYNFKATDGRQYWRMQEMEALCTDNTTTYLDIYFRRK